MTGPKAENLRFNIHKNLIYIKVATYTNTRKSDIHTYTNTLISDIHTYTHIDCGYTHIHTYIDLDLTLLDDFRIAFTSSGIIVSQAQFCVCVS